MPRRGETCAHLAHVNEGEADEAPWADKAAKKSD